MTDTQWENVNQWAENSGLEVIASLAPYQSDDTNAAPHDYRNSLELITYSDRMGHNASWQIGYGKL